jgi:hypothetical protein
MEQFDPKRVLIDNLSKSYQVHSIRGEGTIALNSEAILYIRSCKNLGATKNLLGKFWFGVTKSEYEKYLDQNSFVVCLCVFGPDEIDTLVFPFELFDEVKKEMKLVLGQWKFNLLKTNEKRYFLQISHKGKYDVTELLNYFDFSPREFRRAYVPSLGKFQPQAIREKATPVSVKPMILEEELLMTAKDSSNPQNFELALGKFFTEIGLPCKRIGGSGETDILVLEPIRFIVDGKSTKADSKSRINFTRIKRHMKENGGEFMVIVSVGFDPAVIRDAEMEGATLIDIQTLIAILNIHKEHVLSPFDYIKIFRQPGVIGSESLELLREKVAYEEKMLNKSLIVLENLDFAPRNIDEIKGRIDLYCEQKRAENIGKGEVENLLILLSHDLLKIVEFEGGKYYLRYTPTSARERLKTVIRAFCVRSVGVSGEP